MTQSPQGMGYTWCLSGHLCIKMEWLPYETLSYEKRDAGQSTEVKGERGRGGTKERKETKR